MTTSDIHEDDDISMDSVRLLLYIQFFLNILALVPLNNIHERAMQSSTSRIDVGWPQHYQTYDVFHAIPTASQAYW